MELSEETTSEIFSDLSLIDEVQKTDSARGKSPSRRFVFRCNTNSDFVRAEEHAAGGEELNENFHNFLCHYFNVNYRPRPFAKSSREECYDFESRFFTYHEHISQGIHRALDYNKARLATASVNAKQASDSDQGNPADEETVKNSSLLYYQYSPGNETYSRKVFVGGLPVDVDEEDLMSAFGRFGPLHVNWPNKSEMRASVPKGYVFLVFAHEMSVRLLCQACFLEDDKLFLYFDSDDGVQKAIQVRPWRMADADYVVQPNVAVDLRNAIFIGGVPRPIKAVELAHVMEKIYGPVACAGIDTDSDLKYPKGAGRVVFFNKKSFLNAIKERYVMLSHGDIEKRVELKPYVLDDQHCDECLGERDDYGYTYAPFFCPNFNCLQYYCERCWEEIHSQTEFEKHRPLMKEA